MTFPKSIASSIFIQFIRSLETALTTKGPRGCRYCSNVKTHCKAIIYLGQADEVR